MKSLVATLFLVFAIPARAESIDLDRIIEAIAQIEGHSESDLGGRCRMLKATWYDRTRLSYALSRFPEHATPVYRAHLRWIMAQFKTKRIAVTPETLYLAWRRGVEGAVVRLRGRMPNEAVRCGRVYGSLNERKPCLPAAPSAAVAVPEPLPAAPVFSPPLRAMPSSLSGVRWSPIR